MITVNANNSLDILDKSTGILYENQALIEENGDAGDSFNYSPPKKDYIIKSADVKPVVTVEESGLISKMTLSYQLTVPKNLEERAAGRLSILFPISLELTLKAGSPIIDFRFSADNRYVDSHRLCILFDSAIASKTSKADHQFGLIERPVVREKEMALYQENPEKWNEVPIAIEPCQSYVTLDNEERGIAVIPKGVREYEIVGENYETIRLTLFRTYGYMGRENLVYRPGRASGETVVATPDAQCHKNMVFDFAVLYYKGDMDAYGLPMKVSNYLKELQIYQDAAYLNTRLRFTQPEAQKTLAKENSLFTIAGDSVLSVIKKAEKRSGYIIRVYNGYFKKKSTVDIIFNRKVASLERVNLKEETKEHLGTPDSMLLSNLGHNKCLTLYVEFKT